MNAISVGNLYRLIVSRKNSGAWLINAIAAGNSDSTSDEFITKFCATKFNEIPVFSKK